MTSFLNHGVYVIHSKSIAQHAVTLINPAWNRRSPLVVDRNLRAEYELERDFNKVTFFQVNNTMRSTETLILMLMGLAVVPKVYSQLCLADDVKKDIDFKYKSRNLYKGL